VGSGCIEHLYAFLIDDDVVFCFLHAATVDLQELNAGKMCRKAPCVASPS
jgi:hypothetical protein